ncbi:caspase-like [Drosophila montana]|uniref:caspase-like n=1 Tax=Drosophila montana TaxID=40370 RepID=UPI00313B5587
MADRSRNPEYNMSHKHRGIALIFNNEHFEDPHLKLRKGTHKDSENLGRALKQLGFQVKEYTDLCSEPIMKIIKEASGRDHSDCDCILIAILSHGKLNYIHAKDKAYPVESILSPFTAERCPSLAGKPKLFIIQACQGVLRDPGCHINRPESSERDNESFISYRIPLPADFLIASSTIPGYCSWRNTVEGSWFIQSLCKELDSFGKTRDVLTQMTFVAQRVAVNYESFDEFNPRLDGRKQISSTMSTLTRILFFRDKNDTSNDDTSNDYFKNK